jgi:hypothetical protein
MRTPPHARFAVKWGRSNVFPPTCVDLNIRFRARGSCLCACGTPLSFSACRTTLPAYCRLSSLPDGTYTPLHAIAALLDAVPGRIGQVVGGIGKAAARFVTAHRGEQNAQSNADSQSQKKSLHATSWNTRNFLRCQRPPPLVFTPAEPLILIKDAFPNARVFHEFPRAALNEYDPIRYSSRGPEHNRENSRHVMVTCYTVRHDRRVRHFHRNCTFSRPLPFAG